MQHYTAGILQGNGLSEEEREGYYPALLLNSMHLLKGWTEP